MGTIWCLNYRTAVCGPACTVVWQGGAREGSPYAESRVYPVYFVPRKIQNTAVGNSALVGIHEKKDRRAYLRSLL